MSLQSGDVILYRASLVSDDNASLNGGRNNGIVVVSNTKGLLPDVYSAARAAGVTHVRKVFARNAATDLTPALNTRVFLSQPSTGDDHMLLRPSTHTETLGQVLAATRYYGVGTLSAAAATGAFTLVVKLEHASQAVLTPFKGGDMIRVAQPSKGYDPDYLTVSGVAYADGNVTLTLSQGVTRDWTPAAGAVFVSSCLPGPATLVSTVSAPTTASANGAFGAVIPDAAGAAYQRWTITITNASTGAFRLDGDSLGSGVATGTIGTDFAPINADFSAPYFTIKSTAWSGVWASGDTLVFTTTPGDIPVWIYAITPAGAGSTAADISVLAFAGEGA